MDDTLATSLLSCLVNELSASDEQKAEISKITQAIHVAQNIGKVGGNILLSFLETKTGGYIPDKIKASGHYLTINVKDKTTEKDFLTNVGRISRLGVVK